MHPQAPRWLDSKIADGHARGFATAKIASHLRLGSCAHNVLHCDI